MESVSQWIQQDDLPPPREHALQAGDPALSQLTVFDRQLLAELSEGEPLLFLRRTQTLTDVGLWFRRAPLWLACLPDSLLVFAHGSRPVRERYALDEIQASFYNHVTGDLVLAKAGSMEPTRSLKLEVNDAYQVLAQLFATEEH